MKVWITKYVPTKGILEDYSTPPQHSSWWRVHGYGIAFQFGKDIWVDKELAIKHANEMRDKEIIRLQKQIERLQMMVFE